MLKPAQKSSVRNPYNFGTDPDADPYLWRINPDPNYDPAIFVRDLQDVLLFWMYIYIIFKDKKS